MSVFSVRSSRAREKSDGIAAGAGLLWIADTNNHAVRVVDPATGATRTLEIRGLEPPPHVVRAATDRVASARAMAAPPPPAGSPLVGFGAAAEVDAGRVQGGLAEVDGARVARIVVVAEPPEGWKLNDMTPLRWRLAVEGPAGAVDAAQAAAVAGKETIAKPAAGGRRPGEFTVAVPLVDTAPRTATTRLVITIDAILCEAAGSTCRPSSVRAGLLLALDETPEPAFVTVPLP